MPAALPVMSENLQSRPVKGQPGLSIVVTKYQSGKIPESSFTLDLEGLHMGIAHSASLYPVGELFGKPAEKGLTVTLTSSSSIPLERETREGS